jgi:hypothetical protein
MGNALVRYGSALMLLFYGFSKINGSHGSGTGTITGETSALPHDSTIVRW